MTKYLSIYNPNTTYLLAICFITPYILKDTLTCLAVFWKLIHLSQKEEEIHVSCFYWLWLVFQCLKIDMSKDTLLIVLNTRYYITILAFIFARKLNDLAILNLHIENYLLDLFSYTLCYGASCISYITII